MGHWKKSFHHIRKQKRQNTHTYTCACTKKIKKCGFPIFLYCTDFLVSWICSLEAALNMRFLSRQSNNKGRCSCVPTMLWSVQLSRSVVSGSVTPWIAARQASLSITSSRSSFTLTSIKSVMPSSHLILCGPLLLLPPIPPSIRVFSNESALCIRWPKYWSFSFNISPSNEYSGQISFRIDGLISSQSKGLSRVFSSTTVQKHRFFGAHPSFWSNFHISIWLLEKP